MKRTPEQAQCAAALRGKVIARVLTYPFSACDGVGLGGTRGATITSDPVLVFTDGSRLRFAVQETETGEYGIALVFLPRAKSK